MRLIYGADLEPYHAERHVVLGAKDSPETLANLEYAWCNAEDSQIAPLYTARAMLPFLLAGNLRTPNKFFLFFTTRLSSKAGLRIQQVSTLSSDLRVYLSLQLLNFLGLLLLSVERGNPSLFRQSKSHHAAHLKDANWDEPLDQSNAPTHTGTVLSLNPMLYLSSNTFMSGLHISGSMAARMLFSLIVPSRIC